MQLLIEYSASPNILSDDDRCAFVRACWDWHDDNDTSIVRILIRAEAQPNALKFGLKGPLQAAAGRDAINTVHLLLEVGADVNPQGGLYGSPLQATIAAENTEIAILLLEAGADVNIMTGCFEGALHNACNAGISKLSTCCSNTNKT